MVSITPFKKTQSNIRYDIILPGTKKLSDLKKNRKKIGSIDWIEGKKLDGWLPQPGNWQIEVMLRHLPYTANTTSQSSFNPMKSGLFLGGDKLGGRGPWISKIHKILLYQREVGMLIVKVKKFGKNTYRTRAIINQGL